MKALRILLDKNVPYPLKRHLSKFQVQTADEEGWGRMSNGDLIAQAEQARFDVLVTCDQNIRYQQDLKHHRLSMVVLGSNVWPAVLLKVSAILEAVERSSPGSFEFVDIPVLPKRRRIERR